jgi:hypothetical protein
MRSIDNALKENERIIYRAKHHWGVLLGPILVILIAWFIFGSKGPQSIILFAFGFIWGIFSYISLRKSEIVLTDSRLLINVGFPLERFFNIPLNDIINFDFYQPSLGSILNFGKIIFVLKDKKKKAFRFINSPADLVLEVHKQAMAIRDNKKPASTNRRKKNRIKVS